MIENLPKPIAIYIEAENEGFASIKKWKAETKKKYQHTVDPLRLVEQGDKFVVTNKLTGNFPGSPIELDFVFTLHGDTILSLEILS
jgi:hypothetical protein